ncbi:hypothetical protein NXW64_12450 [Bacteroides ovatus]|nr:hypothetical protein NXW64_12450 [Bacteroides ovatus]UVP26612.1 hypothetical protein NXX95_11370 [Bacteroides xylanisolvens]
MYLFCNHTKCPRRNKCLRFQAAMIVPPKCSSLRSDQHQPCSGE